jgi:hypothetical protein
MKLQPIGATEKEINWDTYRFGRVGRPRKLDNDKTVIRVSMDTVTVKRINNLADRLNISLASALQMLISTNEAEAIEPTPAPEPRKQDNSKRYSIVNTIHRAKRRHSIL